MPDADMTFIEHLEELRKRLIISIITIAIVSIICYFFSEKILNIFIKPIKDVLPEGKSLVFTKPAEAFLIYIKTSIVSGVFLSSPVVLFEVWAFIAPALYEHEKRIALPSLFISIILFLTGCLFCYFLILPIAFKYLIGGFSSELIQPMISIGSYLSFSFILLLSFGIVFETPLVLVLLGRLGIIQSETLRGKRAYIIVIIFIISAILTPPDVISQCLMALPLLLLFEISLITMRIFEKKKASE